MDHNNSDNELRHRSHHHRHHRRKKFWRIFWIVLGVFLVVDIIAVIIAWHNIHVATNNMYNPMSNEISDRKVSDTLKDKKPMSLLLLGTDTGEFGRYYKGRTDTIMMMVINPKTNKTTVVSLPRDMKVNLPSYPDYSPAKINSAYTYGGVDETVKTIKKYFNIPTDAYVMVNMGGLEKAIDQVGGVTVKSPLTFDYEGYHFTKGATYHMNGKKALAFSRMRYDDPRGDYGRQERQRLVIMALLKSSISYKTVVNQPFLNSVSKQTMTNLTFDNMVALAQNYRHATDNVTTDYAHGQGDWEGGVAYESVSQAECQRISNKLRAALGLKPETLKTGE